MTTPYNIQPPNPAFLTGENDAPKGPATDAVQQPELVALTNPTGGSTVAAPMERYFTAEDIERVRREEKDKLYGRIEQTEARFKEVAEQLAGFQSAQQAAAVEAQNRQTAEAQALKEQAEAELSAKELISIREAEWNKRLAQIEADRDTERQILAKEREFADLRAYIAQRAREETELIAPELIDLIDGSTRDEVEARVLALRAKTDAILQNAMQAQQAQRAQMRGVSTAGYASSGPMENETAQRNLTSDELKNMPMSDYAKIRGQLLGNQNQQANRGLYG